jgi:putative membrane protein
MTSIRIALNERRRQTAGTLPELAMVTAVLIPLLYASFYLYARFDPYSRLDKLSAAVVTSDAGTDLGGQHRNVGREVSDELVKSGTFQWHEVSAEEALAGSARQLLFRHRHPQGLRRRAAVRGNFQPQQATIAQQIAEQVRKTIAEKVGCEAADRFLVGFSTIYGKVAEAVNGAAKLADGPAQRLQAQAIPAAAWAGSPQ